MSWNYVSHEEKCIDVNIRNESSTYSIYQKKNCLKEFVKTLKIMMTDIKDTFILI